MSTTMKGCSSPEGGVPAIELQDMQHKRWQRMKERYQPPPPPESYDDSVETPLATASIYSKLTFHWMASVMRIGFRRPLQSADLPRLDESRHADVLVERLFGNIKKRQDQRAALNAKPRHPSLLRECYWVLKAATHPSLPTDYKAFGPTDTVSERVDTIRNEWLKRGSKRGGGMMLALALLDSFPGIWTAPPYKMLVDALGICSPLLTKAIIRFSQQEYAASHGTLDVESPKMGSGIGMAFGLFILYLFQAVMQTQYNFVVQHEGLMARGALSQAVYTAAFKHSVESRAKHPTGKLLTHMSADMMRIYMVPRYLCLVIVPPMTLVAALILLCLQIGVSGIIGVVVIMLAAPVQGWMMKGVYRQREKSTVFTENRSRLLQELLSSMSTIKIFTYEIPFLSQLDKIRRNEIRGVRNIQFLRSVADAIMFSLPLVGSVFAFIMYSALNPGMDIANLFTALTYFNLLQGPLTNLPQAFAGLADCMNALRRMSTVFDADQRDEVEEVDRGLDVAVRIEATFQWDRSLVHEDDKGKGKALEPFAIRDLRLEVPRGQLVAIVGPVGAGKSSIFQAILGEMRLVEGSVKLGGKMAYCQQSAWIQNATLRDNILFGRPWDEERYWRCIQQASMTRDLEILPGGDSTEIGEKGVNLSGGQRQRVAIARALYFDADIYLLDDPLSALDAHVGRAVFDNAILGLRTAGKTVLLVTHAVHLLSQVDYIYSIQGGRIEKQGTFSDFSFMVEADPESEKKESFPMAETKPVGSAKTEGGLTMAEERITGAVGPRVYGAYFKAGHLLWLLPLSTVIVLMQASELMATVWLIYWESNKFHRSLSFYQGMYAMLGILAAGFTGLTGVTLALLAINASRNLFNKGLRQVFFSPMRFFDTTPLGRIQGIFSTDVNAIDNMVPESLRMTLIFLASLVGSIIIITIQFPYYIAIVAIAAGLYGVLVFYYRRFAREVKRLDAIHRSQLFSHFSESLTGLHTIRAYGVTRKFIALNAKLVDLQNRATLLSNCGMQWLLLRLEVMGSFLILAVGLMCTAGGKSIGSGQVALVMNYVIQGTTTLTDLATAVTLLETSMNAVERILYYTDDKLPQEAEYEKEAPPNWPSRGEIKVDKLVMSYGKEIVLKGISLEIKGGERVGIVGRTGAGKSSVTVALYRMVEALSGRIAIDGIDTASLGLRNLRSSLSIIPQDPVLFSGTLRSNLDPFDNFTDAHLNDAIHQANLGIGFSLDMTIDDGGSNLSVGQRSLVSLARALVRDSKILILDEATASVDQETDAEVQRVIKQCDKTIICIAHRLQTIIGWDKIVVMEAGEIVEFASPLELFDMGGVFRGMCNESRITRAMIAASSS